MNLVGRLMIPRAYNKFVRRPVEKNLLNVITDRFAHCPIPFYRFNQFNSTYTIEPFIY